MLLHSKIMGEGKPLIILHGFLGTGDNWKTLGNRFAAAGFQVHLLDQRNHGRSFHSDTFNYPAMAGDVLHYLDAHNIETSRVMGHSMGGKTAMQLAVAHPQRVSRLVVVDISPKAYPQHHQDILKGLNSLDFNTISSRAEADGALGDYIKDPGVRQFLLKNLYWKEKGVLGLRINLPALTENTQNIGRPLPTGTMYGGSTCFIKGERSSYIEIQATALIKKHFPNATVKEIPNAGHWVHAENPSAFYGIVVKFL